jgi:hypothetical protein
VEQSTVCTVLVFGSQGLFSDQDRVGSSSVLVADWTLRELNEAATSVWPNAPPPFPNVPRYEAKSNEVFGVRSGVPRVKLSQLSSDLSESDAQQLLVSAQASTYPVAHHVREQLRNLPSTPEQQQAAMTTALTELR